MVIQGRLLPVTTLGTPPLPPFHHPFHHASPPPQPPPPSTPLPTHQLALKGDVLLLLPHRRLLHQGRNVAAAAARNQVWGSKRWRGQQGCGVQEVQCKWRTGVCDRCRGQEWSVECKEGTTGAVYKLLCLVLLGGALPLTCVGPGAPRGVVQPSVCGWSRTRRRSQRRWGPPPVQLRTSPAPAEGEGGNGGGKESIGGSGGGQEGLCEWAGDEWAGACRR